MRDDATAGASPSPPVPSVQSVVPVQQGRLTTAYDVQKAVGKGGYAIVYKAIRREDSRVVAVKKVEIFEMSQKKRERCLQEVTLLQQLSHPNIILMLDAFIDENMLIIIFEWAPAGDLKRLIKKTSEGGRTLDEGAIWGFFHQIADGLRYMHQMRIMHRDIKPANVLVGANGALKLGDLGLGRQLSEQTMEAFSKVGTPYYVSPEVVRGAGYDWKSDVWSMGCLLYELACLRSPFEMEGANLYDVFQKISKGDYTQLPADQFSLPLRQIVQRMLQIDPSKRPDLEEVWSLSKRIVDAQKQSRQDVYTVSEILFGTLIALEAEVSARLMAGGSGSRRLLLPAPPYETLRLLHPLYFAEALRSGGLGSGTDSDVQQKRQLGVFMQVFAWLLRINGKPEAAAGIEAQLEQVPVPLSRAQAPRTPQRSSSSSKLRRNSSSNANTASIANVNGVPSPSPPSTAPSPLPPATIPLAINLLKGAELVKKAAQGLGLSTEFAPLNALASGYGRAVCAILQDALTLTLAKLPLIPREIRRTAEPAAQELEDVDDHEFEGPADSLITCEDTHGLDAWGAACDTDEEEALYDDPHFAARLTSSAQASTSASATTNGRPHSRGVTDNSSCSRGDRPGSRGFDNYGQPSSKGHNAGAGNAVGGIGNSGSRGSKRPDSRDGEGAGGGGRRTHSLAMRAEMSAVDANAWRAEAERVAPQLNQVRIAAGDTYADWMYRWSELKGSVRSIISEVPAASTALQHVSKSVEDHLERIDTREQFVNTESADTLEIFRQARTKLADLQHDQRQSEDLLEVGHAALRELSNKIESVAAQIQDRAGGMDGALPVKRMRDAIRTLKQDIAGMDVRLGVAMQALAVQQRKRLLKGGAVAEAGDI